MSKIRSFVRQELCLCIAFLAALVSCFFVPPDSAYIGYLDLRTLVLLYCLMVVVSGLRSAGVFELLSDSFCRRLHTPRALALVLVLLCFFVSMFVTNDVALLTFVPFSVAILGLTGQQKQLAYVVVLQTVAANLGSMLTPVGNPQNLYLYSYYHISVGDFFRTTAPVWFISLLLVALLCLPVSAGKIQISLGEKPHLDRKRFTVYGLLFLFCLSVVFRLLSWPILLAGIITVLLIYDRKCLLKADFMLLLTFVCFFVFSGNLARIPYVKTLLSNLLAGRELIVGALTSQFISNVPAALLLSGFTEASDKLLLGVNIGGLGTPVASLASLISLKLYSHTENASTGRFLGVFSVVNFALLALLLCLANYL